MMMVKRSTGKIWQNDEGSHPSPLPLNLPTQSSGMENRNRQILAERGQFSLPVLQRGTH